MLLVMKSHRHLYLIRANMNKCIQNTLLATHIQSTDYRNVFKHLQFLLDDQICEGRS